VTDALTAFAAEVGPPRAGAVAAAGGRTQWHVGRIDGAGTGVREVTPPGGIVAIEAADMTARLRASTTVAELDAALAAVGQTVALPAWPGATVGGVLAVGHAGLAQLGWGPVRDVLLEARVVTADGRLVKAGGPTVKNVSGYDLCRLLVGSLGTLALIGEVVLRTRPRPAVARWLAGTTDPFALARELFRPAAVLWDGTTTWALLDGHPDDVADQAGRAARAGLADADGPPDLPPYRWSLRPSELVTLAATAPTTAPAAPDAPGSPLRVSAPATGAAPRLGAGGHPVAASAPATGPAAVPVGRFVAEVGVGVVHADSPPPPRPVDRQVVALHRRIKAVFDPTGRLNPGRDPLAGTGTTGR
jgi:glycolate oxidase FAD binding subunit